LSQIALVFFSASESRAEIENYASGLTLRVVETGLWPVALLNQASLIKSRKCLGSKTYFIYDLLPIRLSHVSEVNRFRGLAAIKNNVMRFVLWAMGLRSTDCVRVPSKPGVANYTYILQIACIYGFIMSLCTIYSSRS